MCRACEEERMLYRFELLQQIANGEMPRGVTEEELRAMDLPLPGEVDVIEEPNGTKTLKLKTTLRLKTTSTIPDFNCDSPNP